MPLLEERSSWHTARAPSWAQRSLVAALLLSSCGESLDAPADAGAREPVDSSDVLCNQKPDGSLCATGKHCVAGACVGNTCGDGVTAGDETCDDGNRLDGDSCPATCKGPVCGDGVVDPGEACDGARISAAAWVGCADDCRQILPDDACARCQNEKCSAYQGVDLVQGCFVKVDTRYGASASDAAFIQDCVDVVNCALAHRCGYDGAGRAAACYCGSRDNETCAAEGAGPDAPCADAWLKAARATTNDQVQLRLTDLVYPAGWAYALLDCYGNPDYCAESCRARAK